MRTSRNSPRVGRNDSCPCKSGKKYKKCCLLKVVSHIHKLPEVPANSALALALAEAFKADMEIVAKVRAARRSA